MANEPIPPPETPKGEDFATLKLRAEIAKLEAETRTLVSPLHRISELIRSLGGTAIGLLVAYAALTTYKVNQLETQIAASKKAEAAAQLAATQDELATAKADLKATTALNAELAEKNTTAAVGLVGVQKQVAEIPNILGAYRSPLETSLTSVSNILSATSLSPFGGTGNVNFAPFGATSSNTLLWSASTLSGTPPLADLVGSQPVKPYTTYTTADCDQLAGASPASGDSAPCYIPVLKSETAFDWGDGLLYWTASGSLAVHGCTCHKQAGATGTFHSGLIGSP